MTEPVEIQKLADLQGEELVAAVKERGNLPRHVAIIMDGNGRWAQKRCLPRIAGHRAGRHSVRRCVTACGKLQIEVLTLYTFSLENFNRPEAEVKALWRFLRESLANERDDLMERNVKLNACGAIDQLPSEVRADLLNTIQLLDGNDGLILNLALAYGGRQEILRAALHLAGRLQAGEITPEQVDEEQFSRGLFLPDLPDPDLVIRTSGEGRLSNFLLWQSAYSELLITPVLWPDFGEREFLLAIADFQNRERRYGALPRGAADVQAAGGESFLEPSRWKRLLKVRP